MEEPAKLVTAKLKNGSEPNFAVNGSSTPVVYTYSAPSDYDVILDGISLIFETVNPIAFGSKFIDSTLAALSNGLLLEVKALDLPFEWQSMRRTRDVVEITHDFDIVLGSVNFFRAKLHVPRGLRLVKSGIYGTDDYLRLTVRDNLTAFSFAEAFVQGIKL